MQRSVVFAENLTLFHEGERRVLGSRKFQAEARVHIQWSMVSWEDGERENGLRPQLARFGFEEASGFLVMCRKEMEGTR